MGCPKLYVFSVTIFLSLSTTLTASTLFAGQHSVSTEVQANITTLQETKSCPECNLSGADLNRMDLSGANLQGANLSRSKMFLTDLSDANMQNSDLREAQFGGADLANADLRGADLTGASLAGAYLVGAILDGEMVTTSLYAQNEIADIEETVYVEDTVKPKNLPETEDLTIASRRDFEETPPSVPVEVIPQEKTAMVEPIVSVQKNDIPLEKAIEQSDPENKEISSAAKEIPVIQEVRIQEQEDSPQVLHTDNTKKQLSENHPIERTAKVEEPAVEADIHEKVETELQKTEEIVSVPQLKSAVATVEPAPVVHAIPDEEQTEIKEKAEVAASAEVQDEKIQTADVESTETSLAAVPVDVHTEMPQKDIAEENDQVVEGTTEIKDALSVHGPGDEILQNIEILLDTNRCYDCNLAGADLSGKNLEEADLEEADLSNALLQNADLEGANLKGANLSGADLSDADLSEADCYRAILTGADLTNTNLEGTLLDDANLSGVKGYLESMLLMEEN
jgi:uncharacterized protein YjbI with pentapeptide repeats